MVGGIFVVAAFLFGIFAPVQVHSASSQYQLAFECTCLAAGQAYLQANSDVKNARLDPVFHYQNSGGSEGRRWDCSMCAINPVYPNDPRCECDDAIKQYTQTYNYRGDDEEAFETWLSTRLLPGTGGKMWNCQICLTLPTPAPTLPPVTDPTGGRGVSETPVPLEEGCKCLSARADYSRRYPDVQTTPNNMDPVFFHENFGAAQGNTWNCALCDASPRYVTDSLCNCPEAQNQYIKDYGFLNVSAEDAWYNYLSNTSKGGFAWKCELCSNNVEDPSTSLTCNCSSARALYAAAYPSAEDPWTHYTTVGKSIGNLWDCGICNDTCPGMYFAGAWVTADQVLPQGGPLTIPAGCFVELPDTLTLSVTDLYISGVLRCKNSASSTYDITAQKIWLQGGALECGTEESLFAGTLRITLAGPKPAQIASDFVGGDKSIAGLRRGTLSLHGAKRASWTRLAKPAAPGATSIDVQDAGDWAVGDSLVIATTDPATYGAPTTTNEVRTIVSISGNHILLDYPLNYSHACEVHDFTFNGNSPLVLYKQAEVGLLHGRTILIQGDAQSDAQGFGAHIMMLQGSRAYVSGIEMLRVGQKAIMGRYPFHWHLVGNIPEGQYIKNSSIYYSYNRCITVHGTNNTLVKSNVCYSCVGHQYFLENGVETGNTFDGNLGILAIRPEAREALVPSDIKAGPHAYGPSIFWLSNPNNTVINNAAASGVGSGFWYQLENSATGPFAFTDYSPNTRPFGTFRNNIAHSLAEGIVTCADDGGLHGPATFDDIWPLTDWVTYSTYVGFWPCGSPQLWKNGIVAEAIIGMQDPTKQYLENIAFVNYLETAAKKPPLTTGIFLYDSGWEADQVLFRNYDQSPQYSIFRIVAGNDYDVSTRISNVTLQNSPVLYSDPSDTTSFGQWGEWGALVQDLDGTLTGRAGALTTGHPMVSDESCATVPGAFGKVCDFDYVEPRIMFSGTGLPSGQFGRYNYKTGEGEATSTYWPPPSFPIYRLSAIANEDYVFYLIHPLTEKKLTRVSLMPFSRKWDTVALEIRNVVSLDSISNAEPASSCIDVFENRLVQSYYMDPVNETLCLRLVATETSYPSYQEYGYQTGITLEVTRGQLVSTSSTTGPQLTTGSSNPYALSLECTCLAARYDYWERYPDVRDYPMDSVYHYQHSGGLEGRTWDCGVCSGDLHFITEPFCNCSASQKQFLRDYSALEGTGIDPFTYYLANYLVSGAAWRCELCPVPTKSPSTGAASTSTSGTTLGLGDDDVKEEPNGTTGPVGPLAWIFALAILCVAL